MKLPEPGSRPILLLKTIAVPVSGDAAAAPRGLATLARLPPAEAANDPAFHFDDPSAGMPLDAA